uniref:CCHC-type domain-containing protein n=1 Tax=Romanomermis culicivorax TaxID=13658 RepID=A0A915JU89_ROMCU
MTGHYKAKKKVVSQHQQGSKKQLKPDKFQSCPGCKEGHPCSECRFGDAVCLKCNKVGHTASVCQAKVPSKKKFHGKGKQQHQPCWKANTREDVNAYLKKLHAERLWLCKCASKRANPINYHKSIISKK